MSESECPHKVPKRSWSFNPERFSSPLQSFPYARIFVVSAESCPSCLSERVKNLREAIDNILNALPSSAELGLSKRLYLEKGLRLYYDDRAQHC
jgi:hypothetical protein